MNDVSRAAVRAVETVNAQAGKTVAAYTFDAGPNCVVYYLEEDAPTVLGAFAPALAGVTGWKDGGTVNAVVALDGGLVGALRDGVSRVIMTGVGDGPTKTDEFLVGEDGRPVTR